ncbi:alpha/beta-Hydrolases superfamily protein [Wolffia australiana]
MITIFFRRSSPRAGPAFIRLLHRFPPRCAAEKPPLNLPPQQPISPLSPSTSRSSFPLFSFALLSALALGGLFYSTSVRDSVMGRAEKIHGELETALEKSLASVKQTAAAAGVLYKSLASLLSSANEEVQKEFELRVAAFVADIAAANEGRRAAIVAAGGGAVVDWLLETVARPSGRKGREHYGTQAESARALACLIADPNVCEAVLSRPRAVPNLLRFIFSFQPKRSKKFNHRPLDGLDIFKGRSMLVASIMDIVTSNCENLGRVSFRPSLPGNADIQDIAAALEVIEEGGMHVYGHDHSGDDDNDDDDDDDGGTGIRSIGLKILGGPTVLGFSRKDDPLVLGHSLVLQEKQASSLRSQHSDVFSVPGLWDDLQREHIAVPFAMWAIANWAMASKHNRSCIHELDSDGRAVLSALTARERTVKWHGSMAALVLLEDPSLPLTSSVPEWGFSLLSSVCEASKADDHELAHVALSAFLVSIERSIHAKSMVMDRGLHLMREAAKQSEKHQQLQEAMARAMEFLCTGDMHLSLQESHWWSGILFRWVFSQVSSEPTRSSAQNILSCVLDDYGPSSILISQGWLTLMIHEVLNANKVTRASVPQKTDKVKTQMDQSNIVSAAQITNQLAVTVATLALNNREAYLDSSFRFPYDDFLSLEPFSATVKSIKKEKLTKVDAADSALATLRGIKALTELCADDFDSQNKIADFGAFSILRRFLLQDDFERLAAIEAYDASRMVESREQDPDTPGEASATDAKDSSSVRVPPTGHIRKHSARLLMILSLVPKVRKTIAEDETLCKWLEDCANGKIQGCDDLKIQSYARAILLNVFFTEKVLGDSKDGLPVVASSRCPRYDDMIFFLNPESPNWKHLSRSSDIVRNSFDESNRTIGDEVSDTKENVSPPVMDVVFIHGLRGGPFKSWRIADNKSSTTSRAGLIEKIDQEAGRQGTCWPKEWLAADLPEARLFSVKYKTNLSQWSGASLPLQEVSSRLLDKLVAAGIGDHPVVFVTHSMGGLVVKQMLHHAKVNNLDHFVDNTIGIVFYSCPHFGSKLADVPWRMGYVFRPAPTIGELRSGSPKLVELNEFVRQRFNKGFLDVLSFSETLVTPIVEGYGGWAVRMEVVPIESAYPGFGDIIVLDATDHINSCKPVSRADPSYEKTLAFLQKLRKTVK